jgi:16S rRNA (cytidine1402-2'-O)-methyltransferase
MVYFIATPIGNMGDITIRSKELLLSLDCLIVENFATTSKLLKNLGRENMPKIISFIKNDKFNSFQISQLLAEYENVGVVSEAGMPSISDPGYQLTEYIKSTDYQYSVLPGACSVDVAVAASGLVNKGYIFLGFVPTKKGKETFFKEASEYDLPLVMFESVHRMDKFIEILPKYFGPDTEVFIARELTKVFEEYIHTTVQELKNINLILKGEFVIVIRKK